MHQSIPAVPIPPPRANPWALAFFFKKWQIPGVGTSKSVKCPGVGPNRRQMPHPRDHLESNTAQDFNNKSQRKKCHSSLLSMRFGYFIPVRLPFRCSFVFKIMILY